MFDEQHERKREACERKGHRIVPAEARPGLVRVGQHVNESGCEKDARREGIAPTEDPVVLCRTSSQERERASDSTRHEDRE